MSFMVYCVKNTFACRCAFLCFPNGHMKVDHTDAFARICFLRFSSPRVEGFFICRVVFKSHVKPLLKVHAFIQPRKDMKIETDQSLNACPATYLGVALRNRELSLPLHTYTYFN